MDLSIVIINWNGRGVLKNCLESFTRTPQGVAYEVIVVDNASSDDSVAMLRQDFPAVRILQNEQNRGFAAANNQAFAVAHGRHVLLLNNDTLVLEGALAKSVAHLDAEPKIGALGCRCEFPDRSFQTSCYRFNDPGVLFMTRLLPLGSVRQERLNYGRYWAKQFTQPTDVDVVAGCFMMVRREVIEATQGFDEAFFMYGEDEEWCSRIKRAGWRIVYDPLSTIIHIHRFSSSRARKALRVIECLSPVLVLQKRRGTAAAWCGNLVLLGAFLVRLPFWLVVDLRHIAQHKAAAGLIQSRFSALGAHLAGLVRPVWIPAPPTKTSA